MNFRRYTCLLIFVALVCLAFTGCGTGAKTAGSSVSSAGSTSAATLSVSSLVFSSQSLNTTSPAETVTITNTGGAGLTLTSVSVSGDFAQTNNCGSTLPAGASCTVSVTFTPTAAGTRSGTLSIADDATGSPQQVALSGTGVSATTAATLAATVSAASLTFGNQLLNSTSAAESVTLTNTGNVSLSLTGVTVSGNFAQTNNCGSTLSAGASCTANVTFTPTAAGSRTGTLSFADGAPQSPQVVQLYGTGVTAGTLVESPTSVSFGTVTVGQTSTQTVTVSNTGGENISVTSASTSGAGFGLNGISTPLTLAPGQHASFNVTFAPTTSGSVSGTINLTNNGATPAITLPVTGTGAATPSHEVTVSWSAVTSPVSGYNTYRSSVNGGPYTKLTSSPDSATSYIDTNVQAGDSYYYVVTSVATNGVESGYSNQAEATVPTP